MVEFHELAAAMKSYLLARSLEEFTVDPLRQDVEWSRLHDKPSSLAEDSPCGLSLVLGVRESLVSECEQVSVLFLLFRRELLRWTERQLSRGFATCQPLVDGERPCIGHYCGHEQCALNNHTPAPAQCLEVLDGLLEVSFSDVRAIELRIQLCERLRHCKGL